MSALIRLTFCFAAFICVSYSLEYNTCGSDFCYAFVGDQKRTWEDARRHCTNYHGYLAEVLSKDENDIISNLMRREQSTEIWLGGNDKDKEGQWLWSNSTKIFYFHGNKTGQKYLNWLKSPEQPNNGVSLDGTELEEEGCLILFFRATVISENGSWVDRNCGNKHNSMCQRPNPCASPVKVNCNFGDCDGTSGDAVCLCHTGYDGTNCHHNIDDCRTAACKNGATCQDGVNAFTCHCPAGFTRALCDLDIDECTTDVCGPGQCTNTQGGYLCNCAGTGFTGTNCHIDKAQACLGGRCNGSSCANTECDFCDPDPCVGGSCLSKPSQHFGEDQYSFTCICDKGYAGPYCKLSDDPCKRDQGKCKNGGTCVVIPRPGENDWICRCPGKPKIGQSKDCSEVEEGNVNYPISDVAMKAVVSIPFVGFFICCVVYGIYECAVIGELPDIDMASVSGSHLSLTSDSDEVSSDRELLKRSATAASKQRNRKNSRNKLRKSISSRSSSKCSTSTSVKVKGVGKSNQKLETLVNCSEDCSKNFAKNTRSQTNRNELELKEFGNNTQSKAFVLGTKESSHTSFVSIMSGETDFGSID